MHIADDHSRWNDDLAAYAIGALDPHDMAAFAKHLSECDRCRAELHRLAPAVELLPGAVEQLEPPPGLRARIMAEVEAETGIEGALAGGRAGAARRTRAWRPRWRPLVALAGSAAVAAAFAIGLVVAGGEDAGGGSSTVPVQALAPARTAQISGTLAGSGDRWQLDVDGLPALRGEREYQAWVMRDGAVQPSSLFVLNRDGHATVAIPESLRDGDQVLVTAEPRGGSPQPTTRPLLSAQV